MKVLHITQNSNGYEIVTLLANRVSPRNSMIAIEKNGEQFMTGGFIINNTLEIRKILDSIPRELQYQFVKDFKIDPFKKIFFE